MTQFIRKRKDIFQNEESMQYIHDIIKRTDFVIRETMKDLEEDYSHEPAKRALLKGACSMYIGASLCGLIAATHADPDVVSDAGDLFKSTRRYVNVIPFIAQFFILAFLGCYYMTNRSNRELKKEKVRLYRKVMRRHLVINEVLKMTGDDVEKKENMEKIDTMLCQILGDLGSDLGYEELK